LRYSALKLANGGAMCSSTAQENKKQKKIFNASEREREGACAHALKRALQQICEYAARAQEPCTLSKEPCTLSKEPCTLSKEPCTISKGPCTLSKEPCTLAKEPSTLSKEPCTLSKEPCTLSKEPCTLSKSARASEKMEEGEG